MNWVELLRYLPRWLLTFLAASVVAVIIYAMAVARCTTEIFGLSFGPKRLCETEVAASPSAAGPSLPVGAIIAYPGIAPGVTLPAEWQLCAGQPLKSAEFPELFRVIQKRYGSGAAGTNGEDFNLPDYRGLFLRGVDDGSGLDPDAAQRVDPTNKSRTLGNAVGSYQEDELDSHDHPTVVTDPQHVHNFKETVAGGHGFESGTARGVSGERSRVTEAASSRIGVTVQARGGQETRPRNIYAHFAIRVR
ncbi:MAG TPA: phage tail protein [Polyangiaceae bacterium]|nr:phage tail protein [Polyangiaceae bacterium]